jgi:hypothetical protein
MVVVDVTFRESNRVFRYMLNQRVKIISARVKAEDLRPGDRVIQEYDCTSDKFVTMCPPLTVVSVLIRDNRPLESKI